MARHVTKWIPAVAQQRWPTPRFKVGFCYFFPCYRSPIAIRCCAEKGPSKYERLGVIRFVVRRTVCNWCSIKIWPSLSRGRFQSESRRKPWHVLRINPRLNIVNRQGCCRCHCIYPEITPPYLYKFAFWIKSVRFCKLKTFVDIISATANATAAG